MAPLGNHFATMISTSGMALEKTSADTDQQDRETEQLFHPYLAVKERP
jgi:hypothetical protein